MSSKIRVLSDLEINKIAAGEVIENPASVVKELVENAIDASADDILVEIKSGGRQLIRVSDNGVGMGRDDALLSLERHATSKIRSADEIAGIATMGFRGEALPSIASISKFSLLSSDGECGTLIVVDGGKIRSVKSATREKGTTIEVGTLFFNVPVRRKFQRSPAFDASEIVRWVRLLAMAHPAIRFRLIHNQKMELNLAAQPDRMSRVRDAFASQGFDELLGVEESFESMSVVGAVGGPLNHRGNRKEQLLFVNGRVVSSPLVTQIVKDAYGLSLPTGRHPVWVLFVTVPGTFFDINVHPQKLTVRLRQDEAIRSLVFSGVDKALRKRTQAPVAPSLEDTAPPPMRWEQRSVKQGSYRYQEPVTEPTPLVRAVDVIGFFDRWILVRGDTVPELEGLAGSLGFIHQGRMQRRILYERYLQQIRSSCVSSQRLLLPQKCQVSGEIPEGLEDYGIEITRQESGEVELLAVPSLFMDADWGQLIQDMIDDGQLEIQKLAKRLASNSGATNRTITAAEASHLIGQLLECDNIFDDPDGQPIWTSASVNQIQSLARQGGSIARAIPKTHG